MEFRNLAWSSSVLLILWGFFEAQTVQASQFSRVVDGDTVVIENSDEKIRIRLLYIDAPELRQHYGRNSKELLESLLKNCDLASQVESGHWKTDRYGRLLLDPHCNGEQLSAQMVKGGAAWVYRDYDFPDRLLRFEERARQLGVGLWANSEAVPPWKWRRGVKKPVSEVSLGAVNCDERKRCSEIESCEEARFRLEQCGHKRLDGDSDGIPCESLCR